jgi:hypothetical protein
VSLPVCAGLASLWGWRGRLSISGNEETKKKPSMISFEFQCVAAKANNILLTPLETVLQ